MTPTFVPPAEFDDYVIVRPLGSGAMGHVFLAEDAVLARSIAIKFLGIEPDPMARQRFLMEARAAARIQHPNAVSIYRVGELGERPYIVSELVRGESLADIARPIEWARALEIALHLSRGLAAAHRSGVVHCDIKPANVMVTDEGVAKLVDFGLAQIVRDGGIAAIAVGTGTPDYMAPELWQGHPPTRRSDVYSLGAVIYELLASTPPFGAIPASELATAVLTKTPAPLETEPRFAAIVTRCLSRDPALRFASGEELCQALEQLSAARTQTASSRDNPYRGLRAFESTHRGVFFGRGLEIDAILDRLRTESMIVVAGASGVGKSSLCRAGVIPAILDGALGGTRTWRSMTLVPGRYPLAALASALEDPTLPARLRADPTLLARELRHRAGQQGVVLFVDQMEELATVGDPDEVMVFDACLASLSEGVAGVKLLTTVRSDLLPRVIAFPRFGSELARLLYFVRALPVDRLREVIVGPALATEVAFEAEDMIEALVTATASAGAGGLPLLSFALAELWEVHDRDRHLITRATLDGIGGVAGALARHADTVLAGMTSGQRTLAREVLLRLVTGDGTRVRRQLDELPHGDATRTVIDALVKGRLVVTHESDEGTTYEIAHEVLVRGWGTLREWLDVDTASRLEHDRIAAAAAEWHRMGQRSDATWRGVRLVETRKVDPAALSEVEQLFLLASHRAETRRKWTRRIALVLAMVALASVYGGQRYATARRRAAVVDANLRIANSELTTARSADSEQQRLAREAFSAFDAGKDGEGETMWRTSRARQLVAARTYRTASRAAEAALALDPARDDARALLGDVLLARALLADTTRELEIRDEVVGRLPGYDDDGSRRRTWEQPAVLVLHAPARAVVEVDGKAVAPGVATIPVEPGMHVVQIDGVRDTVFLHRGETRQISLVAPAHLPPGFVYIPAGWFLYGSAADDDTRATFFRTAPLHPRKTAAFLIGQHEVTNAEWLAYVDAQPATARNELLPRVSIEDAAGVVLEMTEAGYRYAVRPAGVTYRAGQHDRVHYVGRTLRTSANWMNFPVVGLTAPEAVAYTAWLARTKRLPNARLCSEVEWERAARGADGRTTPTGLTLEPDDANIDATYGRELMGPDEVGHHVRDVSPYGLFDVAGNAFEWTSADHGGGFVARGGSYGYDRKSADLANRNPLAPDYREQTLGLRVCATAH